MVPSALLSAYKVRMLGNSAAFSRWSLLPLTRRILRRGIGAPGSRFASTFLSEITVMSTASDSRLEFPNLSDRRHRASWHQKEYKRARAATTMTLSIDMRHNVLTEIERYQCSK